MISFELLVVSFIDTDAPESVMVELCPSKLSGRAVTKFAVIVPAALTAADVLAEAGVAKVIDPELELHEEK